MDKKQLSNIKEVLNLWLPSPLQKQDHSLAAEKEIILYAKRDDLIHHHISGNKFRKLKKALQSYQKGDFQDLIAFGGAFSNLLYTLSYLARALEIPTTFFVRGDGYDPENPTLNSIKKNGVDIRFLNRSDYRLKGEGTFLEELLSEFDRPFVIPEGGSGPLALEGSAEIINELCDQLGRTPDYLLMDMGTAGTISGVLDKLPSQCQLIGIPVLKGVDWENTIAKVSNNKLHTSNIKNFQIFDQYHFGGFAKHNKELIQFTNDFTLRQGIPIDPIYTAKLVYALEDLLKKDFFKKGSTVVWVHAGGLQGIDGFNYLNGPVIDH